MNEHPILLNGGLKYFDLTQSQFLIWTGQQLSPQSPMYNMAFAFALQGAIDESVFKKAFSKLVLQSDAMRTVIEIVDDQPKQKIITDFSYDLEIIDFSKKENKEVLFKNWTSTQSQNMFDLSKRLFDSALIKMEDDAYVWFLKQHHLITDGWSKTVQFKAMSTFYTNGLEGNETSDFKLPLFEDYINHESELRLKQETILTKYWNDKISTFPEAIELFRNSNHKKKSQSERVTVKLSKEKTAKLRQLTTESDLRAWTTDLSLFNIFSTLLIAYLYQKTNKKILSIGIPVPNRPSTAFKNTPGLFTELFPLFVRMDKGDSFSSLFEKVRNESFECLKNTGPGKSNPALSKRFNVVLNYMNGSFGNFNNIPVDSKWIFADHADPAHYLRLQIFDFDKSDQIELCFDMNTSVFDQQQRAIALNEFETVLDLFIEDRTQQINKVSNREITLLKSFSKIDVSFPKDKTIVDFFEKQVAEDPEQIALVFHDEKISYKTLNQKANQLANYLRKEGVKEETFVGLCLDRSPMMILGILAVLKAGGTYIPIDPDYPQDRINYIVDDSALRFMLCQTKYKSSFTDQNVNLIVLDEAQGDIEKENTESPETNLQPDHSAYVIYTSGSTGNPKGVLIEHKNVVRLFFNDQPLFDFSKKDTWTLFHSYCFDFSVWEMYGALLFGGTLVIVPKEVTKDPEAFTRLIRKEEVTVLNQTPGAFYNLQEFYVSTNKGNSIRYVIFGGEALSPARLAKWKTAYPNCKLINMYGITETTVHVTYKEITQEDIDAGISNIGFAIPTLECLILDEDLDLVPIGVPGEMYIRGAGLARAYLNRDELTADRFIKNPFSQEPSDRLYKTGDVGLRLSDGAIEYIGRLDNQVKIRGHRIELGEIENTINQNDSLVQSVVIAKADASGNNKLVSYVILEEGFTIENLKVFLQQKLPHYMIPSTIIEIQKFPLTSNGKVDKKALPDPDLNSVSTDLTEATTEFEEIVSEVWSEVLEIEKLGIHQDFFELGGDSLSGIRVMARINEAFELELPVNLIFTKTTIEKLAVYIEEVIRKLLMEMDESGSENI